MDGPRFDYRGTKLMFGALAVAIATAFWAVSYRSKWLWPLVVAAFGFVIVGAVRHQRAFNRFVRRDRNGDHSSN
jgi:uncharacterized integral membrane protein